MTAPAPRPLARLLDALRLRAGLLAAVTLLALMLGASAALSPPQPQEPGWRPTTRAWRALGVQTMDMDFADLRSVTHRWDCARAGDPGYHDGRCDPWSRPFNYPTVWLAPARWGWNAGATRPLAALELALLAAALWTLLPARTLKGSVAAAAAALSPPVMFAVERGNVDMLVFAALVLGLRAAHALPARLRDGARAALFALLALLKLFPIAAFAALARSSRGLRLAAGCAAATTAAIAAANGPALSALQANTVHEFADNYGRLFLFARDPAVSPWTSAAGIASLALAAAVALLGAGWGWMRGRELTAALGDLLDGSFEADLAAAATAVFGLTFLIGLNYDYRLIFLLGLLPLLLRRDGGGWSTPAGGVAAAVLLRLLFAHRAPPGSLAVVDWALFGGAVAWAAASAADRLLPAASRRAAPSPA